VSIRSFPQVGGLHLQTAATASECCCTVTRVGVRLFTRTGHDWTGRFPLIARAALSLKAASCLIDGEAVACDDKPWQVNHLAYPLFFVPATRSSPLPFLLF
jgi:hypothetical protein